MRRSIVLIGLLATALAAVMVGRLLAGEDWNPTTTIRFGEDLPEQNAYAEGLLGSIVLAPRAGHDGKFYFTQAMDPFYLDPAVHAIHLDRPTYRAQRMLYPTLASLGGLASPEVTAWGLIVVNVLAMGVGTAVTARVASEMGLSPWFGLAFLLNPGLLVGLNIDAADVLACAALMTGVLFALRGNHVGTALALTAAGLTRETMLIAAFGLAVYWYRKHGKIPLVLSAPLAAVVGWWAYVHLRLDEGLSQDTRALGPPFQGFLEAVQGWVSQGDRIPDMLMGVVLIVTSAVVAVRAFRSFNPLGWAVAGFAVLGIVLSEPVWSRYFDSSRALAPVITAYLLLVPATTRRGGATATHAVPGDSVEVPHEVFSAPGPS